MNGCLEHGVFPSAWKVGSIRILLKGDDKDVRDPKSYRPICLLSVLGKLLERLLILRLRETALSPDRLSRRQFGFMQSRSTEDAILELRKIVGACTKKYVAALGFDYKGAFDNIWRPMILKNLKDKGCQRNIYRVVQSYFIDRKMIFSWGTGESVGKVSNRGCPQGSVLSPSGWNLGYDSLLEMLDEVAQGMYVAYADDLIVVIEADSRAELERTAQGIVDKILQYSALAKLEVSESKTVGIMLKIGSQSRPQSSAPKVVRQDRKPKRYQRKTENYRYPTIKLGSKSISFKKSIRYLGVHIDEGLAVHSHCQYLRGKVAPKFTSIRKVAQTSWGLNYRTLSTIFRGVFLPTVAYAAAAWYDKCTSADIRVLSSAHRTALLAITRAYATSSYDALCVIVGVLPIDLELQRRVAIRDIREGRNAKIGEHTVNANREQALSEIEDAAIDEWQARWNSSEKGRTTHAFFPDVKARLGLNHIQPCHYTSQMLTGHGEFNDKLASLSLSEVSICICGEQDTSEHLLLRCPEFEVERRPILDLIAGQDWPEAANLLVRTPETHQILAAFCREVLSSRKATKAERTELLSES